MRRPWIIGATLLLSGGGLWGALAGSGVGEAADESPEARTTQRIEVYNPQEAGSKGSLPSSLRGIESAIAEAKHEMDVLERDKAALNKQLVQVQGDLAAARSDAQAMETKFAAQLDVAEDAKAALATQLGQTQDALADAKTEISQLKVNRNELEDFKRNLTKAQQLQGALQSAKDELQRRIAELERTNTSLQSKLQQAEQTLQKETASRDKATGQLKAQLEEEGKRVAQRDEQLTKLRELHATLDKQYLGLEADHKALEATWSQTQQSQKTLDAQVAEAKKILTEAQQQLADKGAQLTKATRELEALRSEKAALSDQLAQTQKALDGAQKQEGHAAAELEDAKYRTQEFAKEMDVLRNTQLELEGRLTATRDENAKKIQGLQAALHAKDEEMAQLKQTVGAGDQGRLALQDQLRVAKESQDAFEDQIKRLQGVQQERDTIQKTLAERDAKITELTGEVSSLTRQLDLANEQIKTADAKGEQHQQQLSIDRQGMEWRVGSLEAELKEAREAEARLQLQVEDARTEQQQAQDFRRQVAEKLAEREAQLKQAESVIQLLQGVTGAMVASPRAAPSSSASTTPSQEPASSESGWSAAPSSGSPPASVDTAPASSERYPVKIYQVNDELNFLVLSMEGMGWAKTGTQLLLLVDDQPVAAVQLTELDGEGFAVAQIMKMMDAGHQIHKGDFLFARPLMPAIQ